MLSLFESRKEVLPFYERNLLSQYSVAKVTADIQPGDVGQVRLSGVYWRARTDAETCLRVGQKVVVLSRELNTLLVSPN